MGNVTAPGRVGEKVSSKMLQQPPPITPPPVSNLGEGNEVALSRALAVGGQPPDQAVHSVLQFPAQTLGGHLLRGKAP